MWKPGQIVTIDGKKYRVKKTSSPLNIVYCEKVCSIWENYNHRTEGAPPLICNDLCFSVFPKTKLSDGLYLEEIKC